MNGKLNLNTLKEEIRALVADICELPLQDLKDDARFAEDLGIDSMRIVEIVAAVEKKYKVIIPEEDMPTVRSLRDVDRLIEKFLKQ